MLAIGASLINHIKVASARPQGMDGFVTVGYEGSPNETFYPNPSDNLGVHNKSQTESI